MNHDDPHNLVAPHDACPVCSERNADRLQWLDPPNDDTVRCTMCGTEYRPNAPND